MEHKRRRRVRISLVESEVEVQVLALEKAVHESKHLDNQLVLPQIVSPFIYHFALPGPRASRPCNPLAFLLNVKPHRDPAKRVCIKNGGKGCAHSRGSNPKTAAKV